jgi:two-component system, OmpR family, response regulator
MSDLIVAIDDDQTMRRMLADYFEDHNLPFVAVSNRREFNHCLSVKWPSLILLDLQLGRDDGLDLLREIRSHSDVPVIIMTGHRLDETDRVIGFELGADDYIVKPFGLRELLARVRALLRRQHMAHVPRTRDLERGGYRFNGWQLNRREKTLFDPSGAEVSVSKGELALLLAFLDAPQRPLSREYLLQATRIHEDVFYRSIDVQVLRLRRKLEIDSKMPTVIKTERGVDYTFTLPVERF